MDTCFAMDLKIFLRIHHVRLGLGFKVRFETKVNASQHVGAHEKDV